MVILVFFSCLAATVRDWWSTVKEQIRREMWLKDLQDTVVPVDKASWGLQDDEKASKKAEE